MASDRRVLTDPYERLLELGELELELVKGTRWEELAELGSEREQLIASLPPLPPQMARGALGKAAPPPPPRRCPGGGGGGFWRRPPSGSSASRTSLPARFPSPARARGAWT